MTSSEKKAGKQMLTVDAGKLSRGLKTTFEGVAMVFDSLGTDAGFSVAEKEESGAGKKKIAKADAVDELVQEGQESQEEKNETEDAAADTAGDDAASDDSIGAASDKDAIEGAVDEDKKTDMNVEAPQEKTNESASTVSQDDVAKIIVQKIKQDRSNNQKIGQILKTYGVAKVGELDPKKYEAFLTDLAAL